MELSSQIFFHFHTNNTESCFVLNITYGQKKSWSQGMSLDEKEQIKKELAILFHTFYLNYQVADALATSLTPTYPFKQLKSQETPDLSFFAKYVQNLSYSKTSQLKVKVKAIILLKWRKQKQNKNVSKHNLCTNIANCLKRSQVQKNPIFLRAVQQIPCWQAQPKNMFLLCIVKNNIFAQQNSKRDVMIFNFICFNQDPSFYRSQLSSFHKAW